MSTIYKVWIVVEREITDEDGDVQTSEISGDEDAVMKTPDESRAMAFADGLRRLGLDMAATKAELEGSKT